MNDRDGCAMAHHAGTAFANLECLQIKPANQGLLETVPPPHASKTVKT